MKTSSMQPYEKRLQLRDHMAPMNRNVVFAVCKALKKFSQNAPTLVKKTSGSEINKSQWDNLKDAAKTIKYEHKISMDKEMGANGRTAYHFICRFDETYSAKGMPDISKFNKKIYQEAIPSVDVPKDFIATLRELHLDKAAFVLQKSRQLAHKKPQ